MPSALRIFEEIVELPAGERVAALDRLCADDAALRSAQARRMFSGGEVSFGSSREREEMGAARGVNGCFVLGPHRGSCPAAGGRPPPRRAPDRVPAQRGARVQHEISLRTPARGQTHRLIT